MRMIIDTDAGVDDAQAIMLALRHPETRVEAITTVTGNVHIDKVIPNVLTVLHFMDAKIPVYRGIDLPLIQAWEDATSFHGTDGLGDFKNRPALQQTTESEHAAQALIRLANESPGEYTLVTLGPLTNIATAIRLDPTFPRKIKRLVFMGGAIAAVGNAGMTSEYNIWIDPEAAYITLQAFPESAMVSWETTLHHMIPWGPFGQLMRYNTKAGQFFRGISQSGEIRQRETQRLPGYLIPDPLAMAIALEPDLILESEMRYVTIELHGQLTRGQTVIDYSPFSKRKPNVQIIRRLKLDGVIDLFKQALA